jgi:hypothetical protein
MIKEKIQLIATAIRSKLICEIEYSFKLFLGFNAGIIKNGERSTSGRKPILLLALKVSGVIMYINI